ncbi:sugar transferase [Sphingomonas sp. M1A8_2b]
MHSFVATQAGSTTQADAGVAGSSVRDSVVTKSALDDALIRCLDITIALVALIFFAPLMALIILALRLTDAGPLMFKQQRLGKSGQVFPCYKFRTMRIDAEEVLAALLASDPMIQAEWTRDHKLRKDPRVSRIGNLLRRSSLDEVPQLFNVLKGHMSIVGPRPITERERMRYGRHFKYYLAVRPGITGVWQVSGRSSTTYRRRVACDIVYARKRSFATNVRLIAVTVPMVLMARGAY